MVYQRNHYMCFYKRILHESNPSLVEHKIPAILQYVPNGQASRVQCFYHNSVGHPRQFVFWYLDTGKQEKWLRYWDTVLLQIYVYICNHIVFNMFCNGNVFREKQSKNMDSHKYGLIVVQTKQLSSTDVWDTIAY
jgi:hypothetical protein